MFPAFVEKPKNFKFDGQNKDEIILLVLRAHPVTNLSWIIPSILLFFLPFIIPMIVVFLNITVPALPATYYSALLIINYLLIIVIVFEGFLYWYFNVNIITNLNIVDVDFNNILFKSIDLTPLADVEEARSSLGGLLRLIFNYGDVVVQTAGAKIDIDMIDVPKPDKVADFILDLADKANRGDQE